MNDLHRMRSFFFLSPQYGWQRRAGLTAMGGANFFFCYEGVFERKCVSVSSFFFLAGLTLTPLSMLFPKVIGGELQDRLIPVPYSKSATDQAAYHSDVLAKQVS